MQPPFFPSEMEEALVVTLDGVGEYDSTVVWKADDEGLERLDTYKYPNSLGYFYAAATRYIGFREWNGEGKLMGLAPYGSENAEIENKLKEVIDISPPYDVSKLNPPSQNPVERSVSELENIFDRERKTGSEYSQWEKDFAYTVQKLLEQIVSSLVKDMVDKTGIHNVALAGGVALNCKMNRVLREKEFVDDFFVQPVAHDAGIPLGPAFIEGGTGSFDIYSGPGYSQRYIERLLEKYQLEYSRLNKPSKEAANAIESGEIIGWYQGRMEFGPRALGNRSILGDPTDPATRDKVNNKVKNREDWRPFAPSILREAAEEYLGQDTDAPYMIQAFELEQEKAEEIPAVKHPADGTVRPQTVTKEANPKFYRLISHFEDLTGVSAVLNTSFNTSGEPIVNSPEEAIRDFYTTGLDRLFIGDYMLEK